MFSKYLVIEDCCSRRGFNGPIFHVTKSGESIARFNNARDAERFADSENRRARIARESA